MSHSIKQVKLITKITGFYFGHSIIWDDEIKKFIPNPSKFNLFFHFLMTFWSVWAFIHKTYWMYHALKYWDQWMVDTLLDILYFSGGLICVTLHLWYHFAQKEIATFINSLLLFDAKFGSNNEILKSNKSSSKLNWKKYIPILLQIVAHEHSCMAGLFYWRFPDHRRYTLNFMFGEVKMSPLRYVFAVITSYRLMHRWGALLFYVYIAGLYSELIESWIKNLECIKMNGTTSNFSLNAVVLRSIQIFHFRFNNIFRNMNTILTFGLFINVVFYGCFTIVGHEEVPMPEYVVLPLAGITFLVFYMYILNQMAGIDTSGAEFVQSWKGVKVNQRLIKSINQLQLNWGIILL